MHEKIREDPEPEKKERSKPDEATRWKTPKLTYDERKAALKVRLPLQLRIHLAGVGRASCSSSFVRQVKALAGAHGVRPAAVRVAPICADNQHTHWSYLSSFAPALFALPQTCLRHFRSGD